MVEKAAFTVSEFVERHGIDRHMFYDEVRAGHIRTYMLGRKRMVARTVADEWQAEKEKTGAKPVQKRPAQAVA